MRMSTRNEVLSVWQLRGCRIWGELKGGIDLIGCEKMIGGEEGGDIVICLCVWKLFETYICINMWINKMLLYSREI